jgi:hypothetical protein
LLPIWNFYMSPPVHVFICMTHGLHSDVVRIAQHVFMGKHAHRIGVTTMERPDQGHLHPQLEHPETKMSRPGIKPGSPALQASTLAKSYLNSLWLLIRKLDIELLLLPIRNLYIINIYLLPLFCSWSRHQCPCI